MRKAAIMRKNLQLCWANKARFIKKLDMLHIVSKAYSVTYWIK
uniref:Uncharacterized protein n=1 Tax=Anguilla anguilla TaxID=7936 RepID=A0A0E9Q3N5_ANGAN